eukprot:TRINITY_DN9633_c0_g1_i1.p1 TRINITY_DN9633_c0_g1~~TRINITY_DN9633_c0_g1_i1.p1  ORF type:complete len:109 (+),score=13.88 TRINITY_DN9633_c0_g1_i1:123-449(+)
MNNPLVKSECNLPRGVAIAAIMGKTEGIAKILQSVRPNEMKKDPRTYPGVRIEGDLNVDPLHAAKDMDVDLLHTVGDVDDFAGFWFQVDNGFWVYRTMTLYGFWFSVG